MDKSNDEWVDLSQLPKAKGWSKPGVTLYQGCWVRSHYLQNVVAFQQQFQTYQDDNNNNMVIILASYPKLGTTWLKALLFSIVNRTRYSLSDSPLLASNPHDLVLFLESRDLITHPSSPRLIATHIHHALLPKSISGGSSQSRMVYICRNPLDVIASFWKYASSGGYPGWNGPDWGIDECVEAFCRGESIYGPFWDHVLGFWKASLEAPERVLFLRYEEMLEDTTSQVKRIAEFVGFPFSKEEETSGLVEHIIELCSFKSLKEMDVNKHGKSSSEPDFEFKILFRKGQVGDWVNHLSPSMVERVKKVVEEKLQGSGLTFKYSL